MDKRKFNGGKSTKSIKPFDRRKRISISDNDSFNCFFNRMKEDMMVFYESTYKGFLDKFIKHGDYYVYYHYLDKELVYIGKGKSERCFSSNRKNIEHSALLTKGLISVVIIANNLTNDNALVIESCLINKYKPKFNGQQEE